MSIATPTQFLGVTEAWIGIVPTTPPFLCLSLPFSVSSPLVPSPALFEPVGVSHLLTG